MLHQQAYKAYLKPILEQQEKTILQKPQKQERLREPMLQKAAETAEI